ncbi:MAG: DUF4115 domain-containing protein, partial [Alphaproteobacteria bacterium]|nr:DUF4115 domain-containing protein [Alphaproteobacteria bacterium]
FARNYALELELDPNIVVQKIKYELGVLKIDEEDEEKQDDDAQNTQADCVAQCNKIPTAAVAAGAGGDAGGFFARTWKYFAGGAAVILVLAVFFALRGRAPETAEQLVVAIPVAEQQAPATPAVRATPEFTVPVREAFGLANRADATVILQATAETWLKVEDARGETLFSRVLSEGDVYYVPTATTRATVGNAGGIDVWVNGRLAPRLGGDRVRRSGILLTPAALMPE